MITDERLYIDGELVDIDDTTKITLDIKSNLFRDVSQIASNTTYTVNLPKTVRNQMLLRHTDLVQARESFPYLMHTARYFRNGVEVIKDGRVTILQVNETAIQISIVWGLYPNFSTLVNDGTTLNQLESTDRILFNATNEVDNYDDAIIKDYFYASYDVWKHNDTVDYTWQNKSNMTYPAVVDDGRSSTSTGIFGRHVSGKDNLHPVVRATYILRLIKAQTGVEFSFEGDAYEYIKTLVIPLISKKSNKLTFDSKFQASLPATTAKGALSMSVTEGSNVFTATAGSSVSTLTVTADANVIIDISADWQFDITGAKPNWHGSILVDGKAVNSDNYTMMYGYWLKMTVVSDGDTNEYIIGSDRRYYSVKVPSGYQGICKFHYSGYGKIDVKAGATIKLEWLSNSSLKSAQFLGGTLTATVASDEDVPSGGYFPIAYNLPEIKIIDFVKFLAAITGTFPLQMSKNNIVQFVALSTIWDNKAEAADWTRRVIAQGNENKPKSIDFVMNGYAQHNYYKWKEDDTVVGNYDGDLMINNETLDAEKTMFEFPFAATDGNNVPMYEKAESSSDTGGSFGTGGNTSDNTTTTDTAPTYNECKDRILRMSKGTDGKVQASFDINMQEILDEKYRKIVDSLQNAKIITEQIKIRDLELINFDETKPVYLAQYGSYFAITEIKADETGLAEVTMFQLYFN